MSGHTPGKWVSDGWSITGPAAADCISARQGIEDWARDQEKHPIYAVVAREGKGSPAVATVHGESQDEADANARLIAAAPELLESLQDLMRAASLSAAQGKPFAIDSPGIAAARAAIAKATGEQP